MAKSLAVLIVEDSESDAQLVVRLLHKAGFKVGYEVVDTAEGMRAALEKQAWDIVISDYSLPQFSGSAALTLLKETGEDIPFIVVSGTMGEEIAVAMMKSGAHDYLVKGNLARLVPAIERELEQAVVRRERKQAQAEMQASEKRFRALIENSSDAITLLDAKANVLYDSPSAPGMLGYGPIDWVGKDAFNLMHPDDLQKNQEIFRDLQETPGKRAHTIFRLRQKNGSWSWIEATATNMLEEPTVNAIVLNYRDITGRKQAEEMLRENESILRSFLQQSEDAIMLTDEQGAVIQWSRGAERLTGYSRDESLGRPLWDVQYRLAPDEIKSPETYEQRKAILQEALRTGRGTFLNHLVDAEIHRPNGTHAATQVLAFPIKTHKGFMLGSILRDISGRKRREEQLVESESRYKGLFEDSPIALWEEDFSAVKGRLDSLRKEGVTDFQEYFTSQPQAVAECAVLVKVLDVNKAAIKMLGANEKKDLLLGLAGLLKDEPNQEFHKELINIAEGKTSFGWEGSNRTLDGRLIDIDLRWSAAPGYEDSLSRVIVSMIDITERKRMEEALYEQHQVFRTLVENSPDIIARYDHDCKRTYVNPVYLKTAQISQQELLATPPTQLSPLPKASASVLQNLLRKVLDTGVAEAIDVIWPKADNVDHWYNIYASPEFDRQGRVMSVMTVSRDITERKQMEEALTRSEREYRTLFEDMPIGLYRTSADGRILDANEAMVKMFGYPDRETLLAENVVDLYLDPASDMKFKSEIEKTGFVSNFEAEFKRPDGTTFWTEDHNHIIRDDDGKPLFYEGSLIDITEHKQAEKELVAERDLLTTLIEALPDNIFIKDPQGRIVMNNSAHRRTLGANTLEQVVGKTDFDFFPRELAAPYDADEKQVIQSGEPLIDRVEPVIDKDNNQRWLLTTKVPLRDRQGNITGIVGFNHDITERRKAEEKLAEERNLLRTLIDILPDVVYVKDMEGRFILKNLLDARQMGAASVEETIGKTDFDYYSPELAARYYADDQAVLHSGQPIVNREEPSVDAAGRSGWMMTTKVPLRDSQGKVIGLVGIGHDITERKQAEEKLAGERNLLRTLIDNLPDRICIKDTQGYKTISNLADWRASGGKTMEDVIGMTDFDTYPAELAAEYWAIDKAVLDTGMSSINHEERGLDGAGNPIWTLSTKVPLLDGQGNVVGLVGIGRDITERKQADERIQHQLEHLAALRAIDQMIISSFDLRNSLTEILKHVTKELDVDAADVLTLSSGYQALEFSAGVGFRTRAAEKAIVRLGQEHAGRVALERKLIQIPNLKDQPDDTVLKTVLAGEDFVCYYGVPLIAKGSVKGVLEVYHRSPLEPDGEWLEFLNTLADQAALAIDNTHLFENLQRSNIDLTLAYDATIEGWSRAMDLRDKETEGHTLRVTEMTMELAALFGIKDEDLVGARRGALLHDIGKMGVPDGILLKPEKLTEEEWQIMKKHPSFAFDMLSPIHYLQSAMDIPYCHHEKWDGTGYPRGLKGEQIPLIARIFALADVWDALTSDRPYRKAWPNEKVLEYLKSEAGKHFDPGVVKICLGSGVFDRKKQN